MKRVGKINLNLFFLYFSSSFLTLLSIWFAILALSHLLTFLSLPAGLAILSMGVLYIGTSLLIIHIYSWIFYGKIKYLNPIGFINQKREKPLSNIVGGVLTCLAASYPAKWIIVDILKGNSSLVIFCAILMSLLSQVWASLENVDIYRTR